MSKITKLFFVLFCCLLNANASQLLSMEDSLPLNHPLAPTLYSVYPLLKKLNDGTKPNNESLEFLLQKYEEQVKQLGKNDKEGLAEQKRILWLKIVFLCMYGLKIEDKYCRTLAKIYDPFEEYPFLAGKICYQKLIDDKRFVFHTTPDYIWQNVRTEHEEKISNICDSSYWKLPFLYQPTNSKNNINISPSPAATNSLEEFFKQKLTKYFDEIYVNKCLEIYGSYN